MKAAWCIALAILLSAIEPIESASLDDSLKDFLRNYLTALPQTGVDPTTRYLHAFVDLGGDGQPEAIVYISGRDWCGSGGCPTLILRQVGSSFKVVTKILITRAPIRVFEATSHGWRNISVWVSGGGIRPAYQAELLFDGKTYPQNPTIPPARPLAPKSEGKIVISGSEVALLLYP